MSWQQPYRYDATDDNDFAIPALAPTFPATLAGILAVLEYVAVRDREDYIWPEHFHVELIKSLLAAMTRLLPVDLNRLERRGSAQAPLWWSRRASVAHPRCCRPAAQLI